MQWEKSQIPFLTVGSYFAGKIAEECRRGI
jgi:hypothetical protein